MNGKEFIEKICNKLREENVLLYDAHIRNKIESLTEVELRELINFGDVIKWKNERTLRHSDNPQD
jgi:hypothetical protein